MSVGVGWGWRVPKKRQSKVGKPYNKALSSVPVCQARGTRSRKHCLRHVPNMESRG